MRTTLTIEDSLYRIAKSMAENMGVSIGDAVSELMRRGLRSGRTAYTSRNGIPVMSVAEDTPPLTPEDIELDEDDFK